jgi:hypothetical protein
MWQLDHAYAREARRPTRKVANMPNATGSLTRRKKLVCKIKQHRYSGAGRNRNTQIGTANQQPSMIMINSPISEVKSHPSHVTAAVIHREEKPAG